VIKHSQLALAIALLAGTAQYRSPVATRASSQKARVAEMERRALAESKRARRHARNLKQEATQR